MQQTLYLVRHGNASTSGESDAQRSLSPQGEKQLNRLCVALQNLNLVTPTQIWSSKLVRAQQTAFLLKSGLELDAQLVTQENLAPEDDPSTIVEAITQTTDSIMIVGHEPNLSRLSSLLLSGTQNFEQIVFPTASILCLSRLTVGGDSTPWHIEWHINHRLFKT